MPRFSTKLALNFKNKISKLQRQKYTFFDIIIATKTPVGVKQAPFNAWENH